MTYIRIAALVMAISGIGSLILAQNQLTNVSLNSDKLEKGANIRNSETFLQLSQQRRASKAVKNDQAALGHCHVTFNLII